MFLRPRPGVHRLTNELANQLGDAIRTGHRVERVARQDAAWRVVVDAKGPQRADAVVIATEAHVARQLLHGVARRSADELDAIPAVSTAVVLMVYPEGTADALPEASGFVVPAGRAPMTACTWLSSKWPAEAFGTRAVVRCFVGCAGADDVVEADDADLIDACARHLAALVELPDTPAHAAVVRWPRAMPQYELGHLDRVERLRRHLPAGIFVTGQPYDGVGVPDCVRAAGATAEAIIAHLQRPTRPTAEAPDRDEETVP